MQGCGANGEGLGQGRVKDDRGKVGAPGMGPGSAALRSAPETPSRRVPILTLSVLRARPLRVFACLFPPFSASSLLRLSPPLRRGVPN